MIYNNSSVKKTTLFQRTALIILGVFLCCVFLEIVMRLGGFIVISVREYRNSISMRQKGTYRIMCLGESTTEAGPNPYPAQLEEVLNSRNIGIRFSVINKGLSAINTAYIVEHLEENLNMVKPDMVITMMGVNDYGEHIPWEYSSLGNRPNFIQSLRVYKLIRLLWLHILAKAKESGIYKQNSRMVVKAKQVNFLNKPVATNSIPNLYGEGEYIRLGHEYIAQARNLESEEMFKKALELNPASYDAYLGLAFAYNRQNRLAESEALYKKAIELDPKNINGYLMLAWRYSEFGKHKETEELIKKAFVLNLEDVELNFRLGWAYKMQGKDALAEEQFKKVTESLCPQENDPMGVDKTYGRLATLYKEIGKYEIADEYYKKANKFRIESYNEGTCRNYLKVKQILDRRRVRLVCAQYPVRSAEPLKKIFEGTAGVTIVDNQHIFMDILKKCSYNEYFTDMFGGDFGHCSAKGNRILAENIANTVLKEYFHR
jgi:Tfp pilus assembly protein PilF